MRLSNLVLSQVMRHGLRRRLRIVCGELHWRVVVDQVRMPPVNGVHHRISIRSYLKTCSAANSIERIDNTTTIITLNSYRLFNIQLLLLLLSLLLLTLDDYILYFIVVLYQKHTHTLRKQLN